MRWRKAKSRRKQEGIARLEYQGYSRKIARYKSTTAVQRSCQGWRWKLDYWNIRCQVAANGWEPVIEGIGMALAKRKCPLETKKVWWDRYPRWCLYLPFLEARQQHLIDDTKLPLFADLERIHILMIEKRCTFLQHRERRANLQVDRPEVYWSATDGRT